MKDICVTMLTRCLPGTVTGDRAGRVDCPGGDWRIHTDRSFARTALVSKFEVYCGWTAIRAGLLQDIRRNVNIQYFFCCHFSSCKLLRIGVNSTCSNRFYFPHFK